MKFNKVCAVYFSPTATTKAVVTTIAHQLADSLSLPYEEFSITLPESRKEALQFSSGDVVVVGTPVYAGRVPNVLLKYLNTMQGNGALSIPISVYGNRNFDDALIELRDIMQDCSFKTIAAAALVGEHAFSYTLGKGRPDVKDICFAKTFAGKVAAKITQITTDDIESPIAVDGVERPYRGYYQPRDRHGTFIDIRKVTPLTKDTCTDCKICADNCPMGSIKYDDVTQLEGICIKCGACIKMCPEHAKYYIDEGYLYHKQELEEVYTRRAEPVFFI